MHRHPLLTLLNLVFPPHADVRAAETIHEDSLFRLFAFSRRAEDGVYVALSYRDETVRTLIRANKFHRCHHAAALLGGVLAEMLVAIADEYALSGMAGAPILVPIPASPRRARERGGNQVAWILNALPEAYASAYVQKADVLRREHRPSQVRVPKHERHRNVRGVFRVPDPRHVRGRTVILVDDVIESGATMKDAMRALYEGGAHEVIGVALAK